jgi:hypothetical protein
MRLATSPRLQNIGREEREAKLREFVATALVVRRASGDTAPACITLLARAPDSPVARAVASMATELTGANISLTAVLLDLDAFTEEPGRPSILDMSNADIRVLADPRFTSAHEQMVLSANIMWLGDCMRRDPAKRDAFELFHHDNPEATSHAVRAPAAPSCTSDDGCWLLRRRGRFSGPSGDAPLTAVAVAC